MVGKKRHSRWFTRWGGASKIDCSASMPQGLTSQSCLKDQLPQNIFLWFKKEVQYIICNDWIKRKLRHDASVPSIHIYISLDGTRQGVKFSELFLWPWPLPRESVDLRYVASASPPRVAASSPAPVRMTPTVLNPVTPTPVVNPLQLSEVGPRDLEIMGCDQPGKNWRFFFMLFLLLDFIKQLLGVGAGNSMVCIGVWKCSNCSRPVADVFYSAMLVNLKLYLIFGSARSERCTDTHSKSQKRCLEKAMVKNLPYQFWSTFCLWLFSVF